MAFEAEGRGSLFLLIPADANPLRGFAPLNSSVRLQMMITVRSAKDEDAAAAVDVVRRSIQELCVADHHEDHDTLARWLTNKIPENFLGWISNSDNFCVVSESGNCISGVGLLHRSGEIRLFYLAPGSQRRGIGKAIHGELEATAKRWGLSALHLNSTALARPFYEAIGYHTTGPSAVHFGVLKCFPYEKQLQPNNSIQRTRYARS